jgi:hypothetical protein
MALLVSHSGLMCACRIVKDNPKSWVINYNDKAYPRDVRVPKNGDRIVVNTVDEAYEWLGITDEQ